MKQFQTIHSKSYRTVFTDKVFWITLLTLIFISTTFWTQSRVPALNAKSQMGDRINISAIAFDVVLPINESQPLYERTYKSSINWAYTNWKGMTFGFLLAATFITLLQVLPKTKTGNNRFINSLFGLAMGSPLGVCVNCATPIAQGMIHGGAKLETSLALLLSSPTLNPIVLTIAFTLLSFHMVVIKLLLTIFFILLVIPLLVKTHIQSQTVKTDTSEIDKQTKKIQPENNIHTNTIIYNQSWKTAFSTSISSLFINLLYIIKITLPLMILAGLLGSLLIQLLPADSLSDLAMSPINLLALAVIGVFLPVPIAFDVLIINILISSGLDTGLAASLLFSLGIFSIYPALIIAKTQSIKLSLLIALSVIGFSIIAGYFTSVIDNAINQKTRQSIEQELNDQYLKISFDDVFNTCKTFNNVHTKKSCLNSFLLSDSFTDANTDICTLNNPANIEHKDSKAAINICRNIITYLNVKESAINKQKIETCEQLNSKNLMEECEISYLRTHALEYTSLEPCSIINSLAGKRYCRSSIMADRMHLKSPETCNLSLSDDMYRQCMDNLQAHIASESGKLNKCNALMTDNARSICRSTVVALKISKQSDYTICEQLASTREIKNCNNLVINQKSLNLNDLTTCNALATQQLQDHCRINVAIRDKQNMIAMKNLATFIPASSANNTNTTYTDASTVTAPTLNWIEFYQNKKIAITYIEMQPRNLQAGKTFKKSPASKFGIKSVWEFGLTDFMEPFVYGKGIASGDFNNDGWPDLAFATSNGIALYLNIGPTNPDGNFQYISTIRLKDTALNAFIVTFVDIDNDGWQDLFISAYGSDNIIFKNIMGHFSSDSIYRLKNKNAIITLAAGFSDWNKDGELDINLGNWSYGAEAAFIPEKSQNIWYNNNHLQFTEFFPDEPLGESLSILMSDINNDNNIDMLVANDRKYPDLLYFGSDDGHFNQVTRSMNLIAETSLNTMSYDSADFNNDLLLDIFSTDMSIAAADTLHYCDSLNTTTDRQRCEWLLKGQAAIESLDVGWCSLHKNMKRAECFTAMAIKLAKRDKNKQLCKKVSPQFSGKYQFCKNISGNIKPVKYFDESRQLKQKETNKLLINAGNNHFIDATEKMKVKNSYWGWTGKAADLDNDGWQDIYIGNGLGFGQHDNNIHSNIFYHNQQGKYFKQAESEFGLTDYTNTPAYTYTDFDLDGDIDIISSGVMSSPSVFINQGTTANSISFVLRDYRGNRFCIGCKVIINYDNGNKSQIREIKLSGGFMSYDDPVAYFGLSDYTHIDHIKVIWSDGESWQKTLSLETNHRYKISRKM